MEALNGQARIECLKGLWLTPLPFSSMRNSRLVGLPDKWSTRPRHLSGYGVYQALPSFAMMVPRNCGVNSHRQERF
jgi:hypothetical protein